MITETNPHHSPKQASPKPSAPPRRSVMLAEVRQHDRAPVAEVAATVQFGRGHWVLSLDAGVPGTSLVDSDPAESPVISGAAAIGPGSDYCYRRIAMEVLLAVLEQAAGLPGGPDGADAGPPLIVRVVACRRLLVELRRQVAELGLADTLLVGEVPTSREGRLERLLMAAISSAGGVVDVVSDASKGRRGQTAGLGWVVTAAGGNAFRTGSGTAECASVLHAELVAMRKGIRLALSLNPALARGIGRLRLFSDSRTGLDLLRQAMGGSLPDGVAGQVRAELLRLCALVAATSVGLYWVKGHAGDPLNELADRLAVLARRSREAGLDPAQKATLRLRLDQDAAAAVQEHTRRHFHLAA
jgi:ribonuclease HI